MSPKTSYQANPVISFKDEGNEGAVLYNPDTDKVVVVNAVGAKIWLFLNEPRTFDGVVSMLIETYAEVDIEKAGEDVEKFISGFDEDFIDEIS